MVMEFDINRVATHVTVTVDVAASRFSETILPWVDAEEGRAIE